MTEDSSPLARRHGEQTLHHRALLLVAMQHPDHRSLRCAARALSKGEATLRGWSKTGEWTERMKAPETEIVAVSMYRRLYLAQFGATEVPEVARNVVVPMSATLGKQDPPPREVENDLRAADQTVRKEILRRREAEQSLRAKHVRLVDAGLGYVVSQLEAGSIRASLRDIPTLLEVRAKLSGEGSEASTPGSSLAVESVRVRLTREAGGDLLDAMAQDVDELRMILDALRTRRSEEAANAARESMAAAGGGNTSIPSVSMREGARPLRVVREDEGAGDEDADAG